MKKKILVLIALSLLVVILIGCNSQDKNIITQKYIDVTKPGEYDMNVGYLCVFDGGDISIFLDSVEVLNDSSLKFNFRWLLQMDFGYSGIVTKYSDEFNKNMYIKDNKNNIYHHFDGDGAAYQDVTLYDGESVVGAFYFPSVNNDAEYIIFFDDDQNKSLEPIRIKR